MWLPATSSGVGRGRWDHRRRRFGARLLISGRYRPIPRKYHLLHGKNHMISDTLEVSPDTWYHPIPVRYQDLIPRKYHPLRGKNRMIPDRIPDMYHLIPVRYHDLIPHKYHSLRGKNRIIPDRYHLIPRKYHLIRGRNASYRSGIKPDT
uniref:Uncharacterized protein n=1 Tax=Oryza nivara TaxID=4536 RepID=A0A0E0II46_ORYNI